MTAITDNNKLYTESMSPVKMESQKFKIRSRIDAMALPDYKLIGNRVRQARNDEGFTQAELGEALELSQPSVYKIEQGEVPITLDTLFKLSAALNRPIEYFLGIGTETLTPNEVEALRLLRKLPPGLPEEYALRVLRGMAGE